MKLSEYLAENKILAAQWDDHRSPDTFTTTSREKAWWKCEKGHRYRSAVYARVYTGRGCPYCTGQKPLPGETDLMTTEPEVAALWDGEKNGGLTPSEVTAGSHKAVWWRCEKGHSWRAPVFSLTKSGCRCPYCAGKLIIPGETDLAAKMPELLAEWCADLNGALTPEMVSCGQKRQVWWQCEKGHVYKAAVYSRAAGTGCPYCAGRKVLTGFNDLGTLLPEAAKEWHPTLNGSLSPAQVTRGSKKQVWWQCREGHVWKAAIYSRTRQKAAGCPVCTGKVKMKPPAASLPQSASLTAPSSEGATVFASL